VASRLLTQLASRIAAARDPVEAACLRAQRGVYLARQGKTEEAEALVKALREEFGARPNAEVTAWISLVEALAQFFTQPGPKALDRLRRAHALSRAMNHPLLVPLCAAWLAHVEFNSNRMQPMLQYAAEALRLAQPQHHAALARVSLVIADAFHYAGRFDLAKPWYAAVRQHALAEGDDSMISAMLHNVAALRANHVRLADAFGEARPDETRRAELELESTKNYDLGIGTLSLSSLVPLVRAQLLVVNGKFAEAEAILTDMLDERKPDHLERREASFYAERAWCHMRLGDSVRARSDIQEAKARDSLPADPDDEAATHARIAQVFAELHEPQQAEVHRQLASQFRLVHSQTQKALSDQLELGGKGLLVPQLPDIPISS
jgi:tetratricopeptide (TPR) repeat protein